MQEIIYDPKDVGKEVLNSHGRLSRIRKYHLTSEEMDRLRGRWLLEVDNVDSTLKKLAGKMFFNPYRQGIYYYQVQTLFLLGANQWHSLSDIIKQLEDYTSAIRLKKSIVKLKGFHTAWDKFRGKSSRELARTSKDYMGRIQENFIMLQRLSQMHPYGYKLHQVFSALDIKRESMSGFEQGVYYYRLSTYKTRNDAFPIKDFSKFNFPRHEGKYITNKFIGTIVTSDRTIIDGKVVTNG